MNQLLGLLSNWGNNLRDVSLQLAQIKSHLHQPIVVGVSGGADSMALLQLLVTAGLRVHAVHCNFRLRAEESDRDQAFVQQVLAEQYPQVNSTILQFNTKDYAKQKTISIEMAARELRYSAFEQIRQQIGGGYIMVGHHANDQIETLLLNIARGTGGRGLLGMQHKQGYIVRPLLSVFQQDIMEYCSAHGIAYVTDSSNTNTQYKRNLIRHELLPLLQKLNPAIATTLLRNQKVWKAEQDALATYLSQLDNLWYEEPLGRLKLREIQESEHAELYLYRKLSPLGFSAEVIENIIQNKKSGAQFFSTTKETRLEVFRGYLYLHTLPPPNLIGNCSISCSKTPNSVLCCCANKVAPLPSLQIRCANASDKFAPLGMETGKRKLFDYLKDLGVPALYRPFVPVVITPTNQVVAVVPFQIAHTARIIPPQTDVCYINFTPNETAFSALLLALRGISPSEAFL